jgi:hypothetical protein
MHRISTESDWILNRHASCAEFPGKLETRASCVVELVLLEADVLNASDMESPPSKRVST